DVISDLTHPLRHGPHAPVAQAGQYHRGMAAGRLTLVDVVAARQILSRTEVRVKTGVGRVYRDEAGVAAVGVAHHNPARAIDVIRTPKPVTQTTTATPGTGIGLGPKNRIRRAIGKGSRVFGDSSEEDRVKRGDNL